MSVEQNDKKYPEDIFKRRESIVRSYARNFPKKFVRARGARLTADDGSEYIDFLAGCSSLNYGHNHPALKKALMDYIERDGLTHSLDLETDAKEEFLREFEETILKPRGLDYVIQFPGPTGANAVEAALKLARKVTGRTNIIAFTNGFHGVTLGALAATGSEHHREGAGVPLSGVTRMPYDSYFEDGVDTADYLDKMLSDASSGVDAPAAVIVETVQGEGGLNAASKEWLRAIEKIAKAHGALFIVDDIQAGVGRTGTFFSFEEAGLKPDIVTLAKSISAYGLPMAVTLIRRDLDIWKPAEHNGTFRGNCHAFVTGAAALKHFWRTDEFQKEIARKGGVIENRFRAIAKKYGSKTVGVKGRGMMLGLDVKDGAIAGAIVKECFANGLIIETSGPEDEIVKFLGPLTIEDEDLNRGLDILQEAVEKVLSKKLKSVA
ncbi:diaminobutyrate--2-oxoglutarate transaminase [Amphiplicatus metriothermophilus]|uniref:Diaminobutyrate--2-oxoglutarate transaminase n=1 Tax=Amphiplicatus metriothermophilus TaxID=1519374 RepID=A0A239PJW0_9PROT|nr:diaminobutyrate--2-oxoglutarate transaminase [Amphiplicatus metriothermophilus]MBB5517836.1 diaminobutyrate-2-oxoglutarate transaminase [Amphiplicatus metriothermophilus]SNT67830.1 diaminobutyrate aminotransferase apoenzyme [Amphiplicatus metriothermophilus]